MWIVGSRQQLVHAVASRRDLFGLRIFGIKGKVGEADGFVVGVSKARSEFPVIVARYLENAIVIALVAGGLRCSQKAVVERSKGPLDVVAALGVLQLPVGDLLHRLENGRALQIWRKSVASGPGSSGWSPAAARSSIAGGEGLCEKDEVRGEKTKIARAR